MEHRRRVSTARARIATAVAVVVALGELSGREAAADIAKVPLTDAGPARAIPVGEPFYLEGKVGPEVQRLQPVIVRRRRWFGGFALAGAGDRCDEIDRALGAPARELLEAEALTVGVGRRRDLWPSADPDDAIYLAPPWVRGPATPAGEASYQLLVDGADPFFEVGRGYCLFVYRVKRKNDVDVATLPAKLSACAALPVNDGQASACYGAIAVELGQDEARRAALLATVQSAVNPTRQLEEAPRQLLALLDAWKRGQLVEPEDLDTWLTPDHFLAAATLGILVRHGALLPQVTELVLKRDEAPPPRGVCSIASVPTTRVSTYYASDKVRVGALSFLERSKLAVAESPASVAAPRVELSITTDRLTLPDSDVTVRDLLEWTRRRLRIGERWFTADEIYDTWEPRLAAPDKMSASQRAELRALRDRFAALRDVLARAIVASTASKPAGGPAELIDCALGHWWKGRIKTCDPAWQARFGLTCGAGWNQHDGVSTPLDALANRARTIDDALTSLSAIDLAIRVQIDELEAVRPINYSVAFTQDAWLFAYVTPVVGYALLQAREDFSLRYWAVQIHAFPNPIDEPQWSRGLLDLRRAFALELGAAFGASSFGPEDRFDGWRGLPPLFVGLAVHALPYTSVSGGVAFLERRASTLPGERADPYRSWYLGANVQINLPELVVALKGRRKSTETSK